jgi:hypothetical protein
MNIEQRNGRGVIQFVAILRMAAKSLRKQEPRGQPAFMSYYQNSMRDKLNCTQRESWGVRELGSLGRGSWGTGEC